MGSLLVLPAEAQLMKKVLRKGKTKGRKAAREMVKKGDIDLSTYILEDDNEVIGFEPSWLLIDGRLDKQYFNLLSTVVIGEYDINTQTGEPRNKDVLNQIERYRASKISTKTGKKKVNVFEYARHHNKDINVLLHVTCYGDFGSTRSSKRKEMVGRFMRNRETQSVFFREINTILDSWHLKYNIPIENLGLVLDIKNFREGSFLDYIRFVEAVRTDLGDERLLYIKVPPFPGSRFPMTSEDMETFPRLSDQVDRLLIEGHGMEHIRIGPIIELFGNNFGEYNMDNSMYQYAKLGFGRDSIIPVFPFYGARFRLNQEKTKFELDKRDPYFPLDDPGAGYSGKIRYPQDSTFAFWQDAETAEYFDNYTTMDKKLGMLSDSLKMRGVGFYGLSYYQGSRNKEGFLESPFNLVAFHYGQKRPKMGWIVAGYLTAFLPLGFLYSFLNYWEVRNALAKYRKYFVRWQIGFLIALIAWIIVGDIIPGARGKVGFYLGAAILFIFFLRIFIRRLIAKSRRVTRYTKYIK